MEEIDCIQVETSHDYSHGLALRGPLNALAFYLGRRSCGSHMVGGRTVILLDVLVRPKNVGNKVTSRS